MIGTISLPTTLKNMKAFAKFNTKNKHVLFLRKTQIVFTT